MVRHWRGVHQKLVLVLTLMTEKFGELADRALHKWNSSRMPAEAGADKRHSREKGAGKQAISSGAKPQSRCGPDDLCDFNSGTTGGRGDDAVEKRCLHRASADTWPADECGRFSENIDDEA